MSQHLEAKTACNVKFIIVSKLKCCRYFPPITVRISLESVGLKGVTLMRDLFVLFKLNDRTLER